MSSLPENSKNSYIRLFKSEKYYTPNTFQRKIELNIPKKISVRNVNTQATYLLGLEQKSIFCFRLRNE